MVQIIELSGVSISVTQSTAISKGVENVLCGFKKGAQANSQV